MNANACTKTAKSMRDNQAAMGTDLTSALLHELLQHRHKKILKIIKGLKKNSILE